MKSLLVSGFIFSLTMQACNGSKRGLVDVHAAHQADDLQVLTSSCQLSWVYNYGAEPASPSTYGNLSFIPMAHDQQQAQNFLSTVQQGQTYNYTLAFNEPDQGSSVGGTSLAVSDAVTLWHSQIEPLAQKGYKLGSPAVSNAPTGAAWLSQFMAACQGCTISFIAAHYYGTSDGLKQYITQLHSNYSSYPIWVTEFGFPQLSAADTLTALQDTITFFEGADYVDRYAYFPVYRVGEGNDFLGQGGAVLDENGQLNDVGKLWLGTGQGSSRFRVRAP